MSKGELIIEINDTVDLKMEKSFFENIARETLEESGIVCLEEKKTSLSVALVSGEEIQKINNEYRHKNQVTDVLSFSEYANISELCDNGNSDIFLGEIIICPEYVKRSAQEQGVPFEFELAYIFSHGILHLLDFSHGEKMFSLQEKIAQKIIK